MHKITQKKLKDICLQLEKIKTDTLLLVIDKNVEKIYGKKIKIKGKKVFRFIAPQGEEAKTFTNYEKALSYFLKQNVNRKAHLVAIGGGATSDFAGFVASTLYRGISWSVVPTTLLSMIDAGLGGKTGINFGSYKNQIGSFHFPENIYIDFDFLKTVPREEILSGLGELLKYTYLSPKLDSLLKKQGLSEKVIWNAIQFKNEIIKKDPYETKGKRIVLNFGHTLGHAFEKLWSLPHGLGVACGIGEMIRLFGNPEDVEKWHERMRSLGFDVQMERLSKKELGIIMASVFHDKKKVSSERIEILIPFKNKIIVKKISLSDLHQRLIDLYGY